MFQMIEVLKRSNVAMMWLSAAAAVIVAFGLVGSLSYRDGIYWFIGSVDLVLSFIFYPFGLLQFIFLSLIGQTLALDSSQFFTPIKILGYVVALRRFMDLMVYGRSIRAIHAPSVIWALLFVFALGLSIFASASTSESVAKLMTYVQLLAMFLLIVDFVRQEREIGWLLAVVVFSGVVNAGLAIYQSYLQDFARAEGITGNANEFGVAQLASLCLIVPFLGSVSAQGLWTTGLLAMSLITYSILLSFSRGAFVAVGAVVLYGLLFVRLGGVRSKAALVGVVIAGLALLPEGFYERIETIPVAISGKRLNEQSIATRLLYYKAGIQMGLDHPLVGVGLGQFNRHLPAYANLHTVRSFGAHNMYVSVFAEAGSVGVVTFLGFLVTCFLAARDRQRPRIPKTRLYTALANGVQLGLIAFFVNGLFDSFEYHKVLWIILALAAAIQCISAANEHSNNAT